MCSVERQPGRLLTALADASERLLRVVCVVLFSVMIVAVFYEVVMRYVFNAPLQWARDVNGLLLLASTFCALPHAWDRAYHIRMELFYGRVSPERRRALDVAAAFGVRATRREGLTGVWTAAGKLAAVGVRVSSHWIASHGVALNVSCDLARFEAIVPCGLAGERVTSLERELGPGVGVEDVAPVFAAAFAARFERALVVA